MEGPRIWIRVKLRAVLSAIGMLKDRAIELHGIAGADEKEDKERTSDMRKRADESDEDAEEFKAALRRFEDGEKPP
jgi:hypothetical protein